jgi:hypothetical protein
MRPIVLKICARLAAVSASPSPDRDGADEGVVVGDDTGVDPPVGEGTAVGASGGGEGATVGGVACLGGVLVGCGGALGDVEGVFAARVWILTKTS